MDDQSQNAQSFNAAAEAETRQQAREALNALVEEYTRQSKTLNETFKGNTKFTSPEDDQAMATIISAHLDKLGFQIQLAALTCARLDGVDVQELLDEIKTLTGKSKPAAPAPRR